MATKTAAWPRSSSFDPHDNLARKRDVTRPEERYFQMKLVNYSYLHGFAALVLVRISNGYRIRYGRISPFSNDLTDLFVSVGSHCRHPGALASPVTYPQIVAICAAKRENPENDHQKQRQEQRQFHRAGALA